VRRMKRYTSEKANRISVRRENRFMVIIRADFFDHLSEVEQRSAKRAPARTP